MRPLFHSAAPAAADSPENPVKNPRNPKIRAGVSFLASTALLTLLATPAVAAPPQHYYFPEVCNYVPAPFDHLVCITQSGRYSQADTPSGKTITRAAVVTGITVYDGRSQDGTISAWSDTTQQFSALVKSGEPALFQLRQVIKNDGVLVTTSCMINVRFVITGPQIRQTYTEATCQ
jgi:hypothetical protein